QDQLAHRYRRHLSADHGRTQCRHRVRAWTPSAQLSGDQEVGRRSLCRPRYLSERRPPQERFLVAGTGRLAGGPIERSGGTPAYGYPGPGSLTRRTRHVCNAVLTTKTARGRRLHRIRGRRVLRVPNATKNMQMPVDAGLTLYEISNEAGALGSPPAACGARLASSSLA